MTTYDYTLSSQDLQLCVATWEQPLWKDCVNTWNLSASRTYPIAIATRMNILPAYQWLLENTTAPIIFYGHDDLRILEKDWDLRLLREFADPTVALVGFAGAPGHGHPAMRSQPYHHSAMGRVGFRSNLLNAERHGRRFTGSCNVAVLDGLAFAVRRSVLEELGGWPIDSVISYYQYAEWLACSVRRLGQRIRMIGVSCEHLDGKSTGLNPNLNPDFEAEHRWMFDNFADVLPAEVDPEEKP